METPEFTAPLRGARFRPQSAQDAVLKLVLNESLELEREPDNQFDSNAIRVYHPGLEKDNEAAFLGFVAKEVAAHLAPVMDSGVKYSAMIYAFQNALTPILFLAPAVDDHAFSPDEDEGKLPEPTTADAA